MIKSEFEEYSNDTKEPKPYTNDTKDTRRYSHNIKQSEQHFLKVINNKKYASKDWISELLEVHSKGLTKPIITEDDINDGNGSMNENMSQK